MNTLSSTSQAIASQPLLSISGAVTLEISSLQEPITSAGKVTFQSLSEATWISWNAKPLLLPRLPAWMPLSIKRNLRLISNCPHCALINWYSSSAFPGPVNLVQLKLSLQSNWPNCSWNCISKPPLKTTHSLSSNWPSLLVSVLGAKSVPPCIWEHARLIGARSLHTAGILSSALIFIQAVFWFPFKSVTRKCTLTIVPTSVQLIVTVSPQPSGSSSLLISFKLIPHASKLPSSTSFTFIIAPQSFGTDTINSSVVTTEGFVISLIVTSWYNVSVLIFVGQASSAIHLNS